MCLRRVIGVVTVPGVRMMRVVRALVAQRGMATQMRAAMGELCGMGVNMIV